MKKTLVHLLVVFIGFVTYYTLTDPDTGVITELTFGSDAVVQIGFIFLTGLASMLVEFQSKFWLDTKSDETSIIKQAIDNGQAGYIYLGNSIRIMGWSILVGLILIAIHSHS